MTPYQIHPMFYIPLFHTKLNGISDYIKNEIVNPSFFKYERLERSKCWMSNTANVLDIESLDCLKKKILESVNVYVRDVLCISEHLNYKLVSSWCVKHKKNDFAKIHYHRNSIISGIYYPLVDKDSGNIWFYRDKYLFDSTIEISHESYNNHNCKSYFILPEVDSLILFPSSVQHSVDENESNIDRFSLAFNIFFEGDFTDKNFPYAKTDSLKFQLKS